MWSDVGSAAIAKWMSPCWPRLTSGGSPPGPIAVQMLVPENDTARNTPSGAPVGSTTAAYTGLTPAGLDASRIRSPVCTAGGRLLVMFTQFVLPPVTSSVYTPAPGPPTAAA